MSPAKIRYSGLLLALLLAVAALILSGSSASAATVWQASYWNNPNLSGTPVLQRQESAIFYDWGTDAPAPGVQRDNFSVRWTATLDAPTAANYRFSATMDDGMRIWVDNSLVIDAWNPGPSRTVTGDRYLSAGSHQVRVEYFDSVLAAVAKVGWEVTSTAPPTINNWRGEYFDNRNLSGSPRVIRDDGSINFNWGNGSPIPGTIPDDNFSVRWTRSLGFSAGRYRFTVTTDDGARLWVNNRLLIDSWRNQSATTYQAEIDLPSGTLPVQLEYYDANGGAQINLTWTPLNSVNINNWRGEYFNNRHLSGGPVVIRDDAAIDFNWGDGSPASGIDRDNFSVRWTRSLPFQAGRYQFSATVDDGTRVWVNNRLIIDQWGNHPRTTFNATIDLPSGTLPVVMEYFDQNGVAEAHLTWTRLTDGGSTPTPTPIPPGQNTAVVTAYRLNVRSGPGVGYAIIDAVSRNEVLALLGYRNAAGSWIMIRTPDGTQGWVNAGYVRTSVPVSSLAIWGGSNDGGTAPTPTPQPGSVTATVSTYHLNMRSGPGVSYNILLVLDLGDTMTLTHRNSAGNWVRVILPTGQQGWVNAGYVRSSAPVSNLPIWTG